MRRCAELGLPLPTDISSKHAAPAHAHRNRCVSALCTCVCLHNALADFEFSLFICTHVCVCVCRVWVFRVCVCVCVCVCVYGCKCTQIYDAYAFCFSTTEYSDDSDEIARYLACVGHDMHTMGTKGMPLYCFMHDCHIFLPLSP
jgi:hypothetical protein